MHISVWNSPGGVEQLIIVCNILPCCTCCNSIPNYLHTSDTFNCICRVMSFRSRTLKLWCVLKSPWCI